MVNFNHSTRPQGWKNRRGRELLVDRKRRVSRVRATPPSSAAGRINFVPWRDNSRPRVDALTRVKISPRSTPLAETRASSRRDDPFVVVLVPEKKKMRRLVKEKKEHFSIWYVFFFLNYFIRKLSLSSIPRILLLLRRGFETDGFLSRVFTKREIFESIEI